MHQLLSVVPEKQKDKQKFTGFLGPKWRSGTLSPLPIQHQPEQIQWPRPKSRVGGSSFYPGWGHRTGMEAVRGQELQSMVLSSAVKKWQWWQVYWLVVINRSNGPRHVNSDPKRMGNCVWPGQASVYQCSFPNTSAIIQFTAACLHLPP
jgi:hypothetical protein